MINVIGYSLWGNGNMYWVGAQRNIELRDKYFPNFHMWFYVGNTDMIPENILIGKNIKIIRVQDNNDWSGMFWRFAASEDPEVNIFLSRDCDSRFTDREIYALKDWLKSDKDFHIMRDHNYHTVSILGGMWGCRNGIMRDINLNEKIKEWNSFSKKGCDQDFLGKVVYPLVKDRALEHCDFPNLNFGGKLTPFPTPRDSEFHFVGEIYDENDIRNPDHWKFLR